MMSINPHPNVTRLLGFCPLPDVAAVLEYVEGGSLDALLSDKSKVLSKEANIKLIQGIASGMKHLHDHNIIHRDLAARNILLEKERNPKISDFGLARLVGVGSKKGSTKGETGVPIRWMAPEALKTKEYSVASDIWSFGIVVWEIHARRLPHDKFSDIEIGVKIMNDGVSPEIPPDTPDVFQDLMLSCWQFNPCDRPQSFGDISQFLEEASNSL